MRDSWSWFCRVIVLLIGKHRYDIGCNALLSSSAELIVAFLCSLCCQIILEVATVGNMVRDISDVDTEQEPLSLSNAVAPFISSILEPTVLFETLLPTCFWRRTGFRVSP
jgi:hypothetical protein